MATRPRTITDYFRTGTEIDAAVRRAVREAIAEPLPPRARRPRPRTKTIAELFDEGTEIDAAVRRAVRAAIAEHRSTQARRRTK